MNMRKYNNMIAAYKANGGHDGPRTLNAVLDQVPHELFDRLTGRELGLVVAAINRAYHRGRASAGAEIVDDCLWYKNKLIPLATINNISHD